MRMVEALDAGAMLAQSDAADRARRDERRRRTGPRAARRVRRCSTSSTRLASGTAREEPQDDARPPTRPRLHEGRRADRLDAARDAIHNRVRGLYPWPHAYTYANGKRLIVLKSRAGSSRGQTRVRPGTVVGISTRWHSGGRGTGHAAQAIGTTARRSSRDDGPRLPGRPSDPIGTRWGLTRGQTRVRPQDPKDPMTAPARTAAFRALVAIDRRPRRPAGRARDQPRSHSTTTATAP